MCDYVLPQAYKEVIRKARKEHWCCECRQEIAVGEVYEYVSGIWDGEPRSYKTCLSCAQLRSEFAGVYERCIPFTLLREEITETSLCKFYTFDDLVRESENKEGLVKLFEQCKE